MSERSAVTVALVEDDGSTREGLRLLIHGSPGFSCIGAYECVEDALPALALAQPDVPGLECLDPQRAFTLHTLSYYSRRPDPGHSCDAMLV